MKKRIIQVLILVVILGVAAFYLVRRWNSGGTGLISFSGNMELTEVKVSFKTAGKLIELKVKEGDPVKKGDVIARLDSAQLHSQQDAQQAAVTAAQSQLAQLLTSIEFQRQTVDGSIAASQADLAQAEARLRELEAGSRPQEIQEARAAVDAAGPESSRAANDWERAQYDQYRTQSQRSAAALKQAEQRLALVVEGPRKETIEAARAASERARAALSLAEASRLELKRREQETAARQAEIERTRAQLAVVDSQVGDTEIVSPIDGVVLVKSAGATVVTLGDIEHPWLRGYVSESELGRVKLDQQVRVTTDSYPGKEYIGRVSFISSEAEFTPKQIQTSEERVKLVYRIKVDLPNAQRELKLNMPADARILLSETK
jgi:HlyD family secretion protein